MHPDNPVTIGGRLRSRGAPGRREGERVRSPPSERRGARVRRRVREFVAASPNTTGLDPNRFACARRGPNADPTWRKDVAGTARLTPRPATSQFAELVAGTPGLPPGWLSGFAGGPAGGSGRGTATGRPAAGLGSGGIVAHRLTSALGAARRPAGKPAPGGHRADPRDGRLPARRQAASSSLVLARFRDAAINRYIAGIIFCV
jgi:hypothetical protein